METVALAKLTILSELFLHSKRVGFSDTGQPLLETVSGKMMNVHLIKDGASKKKNHGIVQNDLISKPSQFQSNENI